MSSHSVTHDTTESAKEDAKVPPPPPSKTKIIIGVAVAALVIGGVAFYAQHDNQVEPTAAVKLRVEGDKVSIDKDAPQWQYIAMATAEEAPTLPPLPSPARVAFDEKRTSSVGSPLSGRVDVVAVRIGDRVQQGDKLFSVKSGDYADIGHDIAAAREEVEVKKRVYERQKELLQLKAVAEKDVLVAESELKQAELTLRNASAKQGSLSVSTEADNQFWVRAPRTGTIVELKVSASQQVAPDATAPLLRISDLGEVLAIAEMPEVDAADVNAGDKVNVVSRDGSITRDGTVEHVSQVIDPQRQTVEVRVRVINEDRAMRPNAFVEVQMQPNPDVKRIQVSEDAVVLSGDRSVIFVERDAGKLERVPVVTGRRRDHKVELRSGLAPGTRYVSKGALLLLNQVDLAAQ
jgi:cobalt-zinc-cadmium efflux system membrane fusion protein